MKITYFRCVVVRDAMTKIPKQGPLWELELLKEIYGQGGLEDIEEFEFEGREPLPPGEEMDRLAKNYGRDKDSKIPYAEITFGRGSAGVRVLEKSMRAAIVEDEPEAETGAPKKTAGKKTAGKTTPDGSEDETPA